MLKFLIVAALTLSVSQLKAQSALTTGSSDSLEDSIQKELVDQELGPTADETAPPPEYPYPGAKEEGMSPQSAPRTAEAPRYVAPRVTPNLQVERPKKIDPDTGDYIYDTAPSAPRVGERDAQHMPKNVAPNGDYIYDEKVQTPSFSNREHIEKPSEIKASGEFRYPTEESPITGTASFRLGFFGPPQLVNREHSNVTFQTIYTANQLPVVFIDYEKPLTSKVGHLGLKFSSGVFVASGRGQFAVTDGNRRPDDIPQERYTFFMLPNTATVQYRFQYADRQPIVPYVEGGAGYFTFMEFRDDNSSPTVGGALTTVAAGGVNLLMDWLDREAIRNLDLEYGINHVYLSLEFREIVGLNKSYDFSSSVVNAGFTLQF